MKHFDGGVEQIPDATLGDDVARLRRIGFDLAPQPEDLDIDRAIVDFGTVQPREIEKLIAREHALRRRAKSLQQAELSVGELDSPSVPAKQSTRAQIELPPFESIRPPLPIAQRQHFARRAIP